MGRKESTEAIETFASAQGDVLCIEGWVTSNGLKTYQLSTEVRRPRCATMVIIRSNPKSDMELHDKRDDDGSILEGSDINLMTLIAPQVQIASTCAGNSGYLSDLYSGVQNIARSLIVPMVQDCADHASMSAGESVSENVPVEENETNNGEITSEEVKAAKEVVLRANELRIALDKLDERTSIPTLHLDLHDVVATSTKCLSDSDDIDIDTLQLGPDSLSKHTQFNGTGDIAPEYSTFLNDNQRLVTSNWKRRVATLTALTTEPFRPSASEEMLFWKSLSDSLTKAMLEFNKPGPKTTLAILKYAKRNIGMNLRDMEKSLSKASSHCLDALDFLKGFPLDNITTASSLQQLTTCVQNIFAIAPRKIRGVQYAFKFERIFDLFAAIEKSISSRAISLLESSKTASTSNMLDATSNVSDHVNSGGGGLLGLPYREFLSRVHDFFHLIGQWTVGIFGSNHKSLSNIPDMSKELTNASSTSTSLGEFLTEQAANSTLTTGKFLQPTKDTSTALKMMRDLLDQLESKSIMPKILDRLVRLLNFRNDHEEL